MRLPILIILLALCFAAVPAIGQGAPPRARIDAVKVTSSPTLDGVLDDECWQDLPEYTSFVDGDTRAVLKCQTIAKICYDDNCIYVAFRSLHPDPAHIRAQETKRNGGSFRQDDFVAVNIDSLHTHRMQSWFDVNALGTQSENLQRSASQNIEYKGDWRAAAKIVSDGYNVEMAIPFSLLVYSSDQRTFGISFRRNMAEQNLWAVWPDLNGTDDMQFYADWTGLDLPKTGLRPKVLAYVLGSSGNAGERVSGHGFDLKYPLSSGSLGVISVNPDFNTVEQQVESVDFSYTERYLDDARPFFSEWQVPVDSRVFYSRRIQNFDTGMKFAGSSGPNTYGIMSMRTFGEQSDTVVSLGRNVGSMSSIHLNMADHRIPGHRNLTSYYYTDMKWKQGQRTSRINTGLYDSTTTGAPDGQMRYVSISSEGAAGAINVYYDHGTVEKEFNGEIGYTGDADTTGNFWGLWRQTALRGGNLQSVFTGLHFYDRNHTDGSHFRRSGSASVNFVYVDGHEVDLYYQRQQYEQFEEELPSVSAYWNRNLKLRDGGIGVSWGHKAGGAYLLTWAAQKFRVGEKVALGLQWNRESIGDTSPYASIRRQVVLTANYDITSERGLGGRLVAQQGKRNLYFMYRQQVRHGTDAYLIYGDPNAESTDSRMTLKMMRTL